MKYVDSWGRYHDKPVTDADPYPCNNAFLFSGYASVLGMGVDRQNIQTCFVDCLTEYGFTRHPNREPFPGSSHDELVGMFMLLPVQLCRGMIRKYERQGWQICNWAVFSPRQWWALNPFKVIKEFYALSKREQPRKDTYFFPYVWPIAFRHRSHHTYYYKRRGLVPPSPWEHLSFTFASLFTVFRGTNSSKVMLGFKLLSLLDRGLSRKEQWILSIYDRFVNIGEETARYFPKGHPISKRILELK